MTGSASSLPRRPPRLQSVYNGTPLVFVTFCTHERQAVLASDDVHSAFCAAADRMAHAGNAVGRYVIMPDHAHVFLRIGIEGRLGQAVKCLREAVTKSLRLRIPGIRVWQPGFFDHVLRSAESYAEKWEYVRNNPVRAGLVKNADEWRFQGEVTPLSWHL